MMDSLSWIALGTVVLTFVAYAVMATSHHAATVGAMEARLREKIENTYNLAVTKQEAASEKEAKARHDLANEVQRVTAQLTLDDKELGRRVNDLSADMVRKSDLAAHETRMTAVLQDIRSSLQNAVERLDGKVDELRDRVHA